MEQTYHRWQHHHRFHSLGGSSSCEPPVAMAEAGVPVHRGWQLALSLSVMALCSTLHSIMLCRLITIISPPGIHWQTMPG